LIQEIEQLEKTFNEGLFSSRLAVPLVDKEVVAIVALIVEAKKTLSKHVAFYQKVEAEYAGHSAPTERRSQATMQAWISQQSRANKSKK
jgi:hypothetical protein